MIPIKFSEESSIQVYSSSIQSTPPKKHGPILYFILLYHKWSEVSISNWYR